MAQGHKTGGREKGTPNQFTKEIRDRINSILDIHFTSESLEQDLKQLDPEKRLSVLIKLLEYSTPKLQSIQLEEVKEPIQQIELTDEQFAEIMKELKPTGNKMSP